MRITRNQLRQLIHEAYTETLSETAMFPPSSLNRTTQGLDSALEKIKAQGTLAPDTNHKDLLRFYQILYQSQIDHNDSYGYVHDQLKAGAISKPITGMMITNMYKSLGLTPMTSEDWARFNEIMY